MPSTDIGCEKIQPLAVLLGFGWRTTKKACFLEFREVRLFFCFAVASPSSRPLSKTLERIRVREKRSQSRGNRQRF